MTTRVVAVDGPGGAGKSNLAEYLAQELEAPVVHTDDFASWENPVDWWPELIDRSRGRDCVTHCLSPLSGVLDLG